MIKRCLFDAFPVCRPANADHDHYLASGAETGDVFMGAEGSSRHGFSPDGFQFLHHVFTVEIVDRTHFQHINKIHDQ